MPGILADGRRGDLIKHGIGVTYEIDTDYERADARSNEAKQRRESAGLRSPKRTNTGRMAEVDSEGLQADLGEPGISHAETLARRQRNLGGVRAERARNQGSLMRILFFRTLR